MSSSIIGLARWAAGLRLDDIPARVVEKARGQMASVLAASFAGLNDPAATKVLVAARCDGGTGPTPVLAGGFRTSRPAAVLANAAVSCTFDYDEVLLVGHPGHSTVTVPLALGAELGATWGEVVAAQVAANEIAARLGLATFLGPQNGQMVPHLHCAGGAVAAGRLLGLDAGRMAHALAVALSQPPAALWPGFLGPVEAKVLIAAHGAAMGVAAAQLAAAGFTGALDLLDHPRGFFHRFAFVPFRRLLGGLGRAWLTDTLQVKLHAACWYFQALLDAVGSAAREFEAASGRALRPEDVRRIACRVTFLAEAVDASARGRTPADLTVNEVNFSIPVAVAAFLRNRRLVPDDLRPEALAGAGATEVRALAARIRVSHDPGLTRHLLATIDRALDIPVAIGSAGAAELAWGLWRARREFPHAGALRPAAVARALARAPGLLGRLLAGRRRDDYDLGARDVAGLVLPIPGGVEIELADGRRLAAERDVAEGALGLPGAAERVAEKLRGAATRPLGAARAEDLVRAIGRAHAGTPVRELLGACLGPETA